jgi:hypothetical protein
VPGTSESPEAGRAPKGWGAPSSDGGPVRTSAKSLERDSQFQEEMMRKNSTWTGLPTMVMALGLVAWTASVVKADPTITYDTSGAVSTTGITGSNVISFVPITFNSASTSSSTTPSSNTFTSPSNFSLGYFQVGQLDPGVSTTYNNTPFSITLHFDTVNGATPTPNATPITITGVLNGKVTGSDNSGVTASFNTPVNTPASGVTVNSTSSTPTQLTDTFTSGLYNNTLTVNTGGFQLVPSTSNFGRTTLEGSLTSVLSPAIPAGDSGGGTTNTPEPTSVALFAMAIGGLAWHRYRVRRAG